MADIWRAGLPSGDRVKPAVMPGLWWVCWLLQFWLAAGWAFANKAGRGDPSW